MGLFDGGRSYSTGAVMVRKSSHSHHDSHSHHGSHSHSRHSSPSRSKSTGYFVRPHNSRSVSGGSIFGGSTSRGFFGSSGGSSSYYKRRPRDGYISYLLHKLKRMFKELWYYARKHPIKAFFAVVVPLLSAGGAIHGLMRQFGVKMPMGLDGRTRRGGGGYYGSSGYERRSTGFGSGFGGGGGLMENAGGLMQIAKMFI